MPVCPALGCRGMPLCTLMLRRIHVTNYRSIADVSVELGPLAVFFGPNGAGKSSLLDALFFFRDCAARGLEVASAERDQGIGLRWDGAEENAPISIAIQTTGAEYEIRVSLLSGRIDPLPGERLRSLQRDAVLISRPMGTARASFFDPQAGTTTAYTLRDADKLSLARYLDQSGDAGEAAEVDQLMRSIRMHRCRLFNYHAITKLGSTSEPKIRLNGRVDNLWSVLRNLHDQRSADDRYDTIVAFMREAFPSFDGLVFRQTGPTVVIGLFLEKDRREPIWPLGVADGHIHLLAVLTSIFAEGRGTGLLLLDEPDISLHPWALSVLARAVKEATSAWGKQILLVTHSPVLLSQFEADQTFAVEREAGKTRLTRLSEVAGVQDLLEQYAAGSLYMANVLAPQGTPGQVEVEPGAADKG